MQWRMVDYATNPEDERTAGPMCPDTLAKNIEECHLRDLKGLFNGSILVAVQARLRIRPAGNHELVVVTLGPGIAARNGAKDSDCTHHGEPRCA